MASVLDNKYGRTLQIKVAGQTEPEQLEGCQSLSEQYWQCDYRGDLLWYRTVVSSSTWDYYWSAFVDGVVRPSVCAAELIALRYGGSLGAQAIAGAIETCSGLFTRVEPNTLEDEE
ncbi:hypothetical protein [Candidatus Poriferisodalis sp.]|uniref:hypothetical protein n=1 Tax=Candidatus Poriferisodalis sp. TaxID=3101277 RepID=UPI003B01DC4D